MTGGGDGQAAWGCILGGGRHGSKLDGIEPDRGLADPARHEGVGSLPHFVIPAQAGIYML
jgi:hypothetical protein